MRSKDSTITHSGCLKSGAIKFCTSWIGRSTKSWKRLILKSRKPRSCHRRSTRPSSKRSRRPSASPDRSNSKTIRSKRPTSSWLLRSISSGKKRLCWSKSSIRRKWWSPRWKRRICNQPQTPLRSCPHGLGPPESLPPISGLSSNSPIKIHLWAFVCGFDWRPRDRAKKPVDLQEEGPKHHDGEDWQPLQALPVALKEKV